MVLLQHSKEQLKQRLNQILITFLLLLQWISMAEHQFKFLLLVITMKRICLLKQVEMLKTTKILH
ncbi:hypothetical protein BA196_15255 [Klebsiella pneumoniae]|nr:hypothetical protein BA196_15255 [Klebsiella pneumoniae]